MLNNGKGLFIQLYSLHGLIRGHNLELGRDADTGGQTKYVFELANMLSTYPEVEKVELITRWISDKKVSSDYAIPVEKVNDRFDIVRIERAEENISGKNYYGITLKNLLIKV